MVYALSNGLTLEVCWVVVMLAETLILGLEQIVERGVYGCTLVRRRARLLLVEVLYLWSLGNESGAYSVERWEASMARRMPPSILRHDIRTAL